MNKAKLLWVWDSGSSVTSEYQAVLDRATALGYTHPSASVKTAQNQLISDLKDAGIWTNLDVFYVFANDVAGNFWKLNWVTPASFACTEPAGAVTKSSAGIQGNGTTTYADLNFTPSTQATKLSAANGGFSAIYLHTVPVTGTYLCGVRNVAGTNPYHFHQYSTAANYQYRTMDDGGGQSYTGGTPDGSFMYASATTAGSQLFKNGVSVQSQVIGLTLGLPTNSLRVCAASGNGGGFSDCVISMYATGLILTGLELSFYNAWNTYKTATGL